MTTFPIIILILGTFFVTENSAAVLDLSWRGLENEEFFSRDTPTFVQMAEKATELILRGNRLKSFVDCSANFRNLQILDLSHNDLHQFFFLCKEEDNLYKLNVSHNRLGSLNDTALGARMTNLQILDLSYNVINVVTTRMFEHMTNLHVLLLNSNPISRGIEPGAFQNLHQLVQLNLENTSITYFVDGLFEPLTRLRHLNLASNPITRLPALSRTLQHLDISATRLTHHDELDMPHLRVLKMDRMPLLELLDLNMLRKSKNTTLLSAEYCPNLRRIHVWSTETGSLLPELNQFSVKNSSLKTLSAKLAPIMRRVGFIDLQNNPWHCDCRMQWVRSLKLLKYLTNDVRCKTPIGLEGRRLFDLSIEELECRSETGDMQLYLWLSLSILIAVLAASSVLVAVLYAGGHLRQCRKRIMRPDIVMYKNMMVTSNEGDKILED